MRHDVVCVDVGGVLLNYSFERFVTAAALRSQQPASSLMAKFQIDHEFDLFELGQLTSAQYMTHLRDRLAIELSDEDLTTAWNDIYLAVNDDVGDVVRDLADQFEFVCITNTNELHESVWRPRLQHLLGLFSADYPSHIVGATKPMRAYFAHIAADRGVETDDLIVIDDLPPVIEACRRLGIRAHRYVDAAHMRSYLSGLA